MCWWYYTVVTINYGTNFNKFGSVGLVDSRSEHFNRGLILLWRSRLVAYYAFNEFIIEQCWDVSHPIKPGLAGLHNCLLFSDEVANKCKAQ